ncbi:MAG: carboxymuconolactone decarboxylase family protein [Reinekea sp.]|jgi:AhpD family alkylhydroperoxidase
MNPNDSFDTIKTNLRDFRKERPEVYNAFQEVGLKVYKAGALDVKTKELLATAIAISEKCTPCIGYHVKALMKQGTTREEFMEMLEVIVQMQGGPGLMTAAEAMAAWDELAG